MYGGRPFGGVAILQRKGLQKYVRVLKTGSANVCTIDLQFESQLLLMMYTYALQLWEFRLGKGIRGTAFSCIESLLQDSRFSKSTIVGDFNGDSRLCSESRFGRKILNFANVNSLSIVDYDLLKSDEDFITWEWGDCSKKGWVDFAPVSENTRRSSGGI